MEERISVLEGLDKEQTEAVTSTEGVIRVVAGAGSGKTRALTHRFAYLVNELGILPGNILCVTFTNKSAGEMRQRIHLLTGDNDTGYINTFHGFCVSILQEDSNAVSYPKSFLVLDNSDIDQMLAMIYEERHLTLRDMTYANARDMIEIRKTIRDPEYYKEMIRFSVEDLRDKYLRSEAVEDIIFYGYLYQEKKCFGLDYNDLIKFSLYIFESSPEIRLKWQSRLEYIMVDEFQDIDPLQYELMRVLCGHHHNLFIVGDPDQTIYTWRGANVRYLLDFDQAFPDVKTIYMLHNYRSLPPILGAANTLIDKNELRLKKELSPVRTLPEVPDGSEKVQIYYAESPEEEGAFVAAEIGRLRDSGRKLSDITILYRAHYVSRTLEDALRRAKIPYRIHSGVAFYERREIKDALAYLRLVTLRDDLSFLRVCNTPKRNLGEQRLGFLRAKAEEMGLSLFETLARYQEDPALRGSSAGELVSLVEHFSEILRDRPVSELMTALLDESGYLRMLRTAGAQERLDNLAELGQSIFEYEVSCGEEATPEHYLRHVALFTNADAEAEESDKVRLMTVHSAKGLEFPCVFLVGLNEGIFPSRRTATREGMEEERRLCFVAMTRAMDRLYLTEASGKGLDGAIRFPSRFLMDTGEEYAEVIKRPEESLIRAARERVDRAERLLRSEAEESLLAPGSRIRHKVFGEGTILGIDADRKAYEIAFDKMSTSRTIACHVPLEVI